MPFKLQTNCLILTYATDYLDQLSVGVICEKIQKLGNWEGVVAHCDSDEELNHSHFHCFLEYKGKSNRCKIENEKYFDIPLKSPVYAFHNGPSNLPDTRVVEYLPVANFEKPFAVSVDDYCKNNNYHHYVKLESAHPNICPRKKWGTIYDMIFYIANKNKVISMRSDFDVEKRLEKELVVKNSKKSKSKKQNKTTKLDADTIEFCQWLRKLIIVNKFTKNEIKKRILKNKKYSSVYFSNFNNYRNLIDDFFKNQPTIKPNAFWGEFWIPATLKNYLEYLDKWVEEWHTSGNRDLTKRPKPCFVSGRAKLGKTKIFASIGDFCYWCNTWNYDSYEAGPAFNLMDDYDASVDYKGTTISNNFNLLKPWFGGQEVITISGKYKSQTVVSNGRPLVFISNQSFEERFPNELDRQYIKDCGCTIIDLGDNKLYGEKDRRTIGGFATWVKWDSRNTWWYKNKIAVKPDTCDCGDCSLCWEKIDNASDIEKEEESGNSFVFLDSDDENKENIDPNLPRPGRNKRKNQFELGELSPIRKNRRNTL